MAKTELTGDMLVLGEARLRGLRDFEIRQNGEVVGKKKVVDVVTWGQTIEGVDVQPDYAPQLKEGVTGRVFLAVVVSSDATGIHSEKKNSTWVKETITVSDFKLVQFEAK